MRRRASHRWCLPLLGMVCLCLPGCGTLLPRSTKSVSSWGSFEEAKADYDAIIVGKTTVADLQRLDFDPRTGKNSVILTYPDLEAYFVPHEGISLEAHEEGIQRCVRVEKRCEVWLVDVTEGKNKRIGFVLTDWLKFHEHRSLRGWRFRAIIVVIDGVAQAKLWGGAPKLRGFREVVRPFGVLQWIRPNDRKDIDAERKKRIEDKTYMDRKG